MILFGEDERVKAWVGKRVECEDFGPSVAMGVIRGNELVAGAVFNNYRHPNIEITFAADNPNWGTRRDVVCIFRYSFVQMGCLRLTAVTKASNTRARTFLTKLGFDQEGYHPHMFLDDAAVSYGMLREKCRWVSPREYVQICA